MKVGKSPASCHLLLLPLKFSCDPCQLVVRAGEEGEEKISLRYVGGSGSVDHFVGLGRGVLKNAPKWRNGHPNIELRPPQNGVRAAAKME